MGSPVVRAGTFYIIMLALNFWSSCVHIPNPGITGIHKHAWLRLWCFWYLFGLPVSWDFGTSCSASLVLELRTFGWEPLGYGMVVFGHECFGNTWVARYQVNQACLLWPPPSFLHRIASFLPMLETVRLDTLGIITIAPCPWSWVYHLVCELKI